jgi:hypothetical protein
LTDAILLYEEVPTPKIKWWHYALASGLAGFLFGYIFRSKYAVHHHPPFISKVKSTTYSDGTTWSEPS